MELINVSSDDFDRAISVFGDNYSLPAVTLTPSPSKFEWRHRAVGDETMTFRSTRLMATLETTLGGGDDYVVQWSQGGVQTFGTGESATQSAINMPFVLPNGRTTTTTRATDVQLNLVHIDKQFVHGVAQELDGVHFDSFNPDPPPSPAALRAWRSAVNMATNVVLDPTTPQSSLLRREMSRLIALSMLDSFPYKSLPAATAVTGNEPASVRLAYEFAHANAHLPIGPLEMAGAVHLSVRSLQHALRRYRETTPSAVLQSIRLTRVRDQLHISEPPLVSVAEVAREWGFIQLGRFAGQYKTKFGESPRETLHS